MVNSQNRFHAIAVYIYGRKIYVSKFPPNLEINKLLIDMQLENSPSPIIWRQVWGLSAILTAVMFSWMAYGLYQPKILQEIGFVELATSLGIIQGFMGAIIEPMVGGISDKIQRRFGNRLPIITTGVTLAGLIFVATAILLQWQIPVGIRWIVPVMMTLWVMSMIAFRGPVVALLRQAAPLANLPQVNSILTMVFGLVGSLGPLMTVFLTNIGASIAFVCGAIALTFGAIALYTWTPKDVLFPAIASTRSPISPVLMGIILVIGLGVGLEINLLLRTFPEILKFHIPNLAPNWIGSIILFISALSAIPAERLSIKLGIKPTMQTGLLGILICMGFVLFPVGHIIAAILIAIAGFSFGLIFASQIPLILGMVASDRAGLGTGLYFGGIGAAGAIVSLLLLNLTIITTTTEFICCGIAFAIVCWGLEMV